MPLFNCSWTGDLKCWFPRRERPPLSLWGAELPQPHRRALETAAQTEALAQSPRAGWQSAGKTGREGGVR